MNKILDGIGALALAVLCYAPLMIVVHFVMKYW